MSLLGGVVFHLVKGSVYLLVVLGASFSFLYLGFFTFIFTYIMLIFDIYIYDDDDDNDDDLCLLHLSLHVLFLLYLYTRVSLRTQSLFLFHTWFLDEFFKCFKKIGCESLSCCKLFSCKDFQEFVVGIDLFCNTTSGYKLSNLRLLSWLVVLLWLCHKLPKGEIVKDIFYVIG